MALCVPVYVLNTAAVENTVEVDCQLTWLEWCWADFLKRLMLNFFDAWHKLHASGDENHNTNFHRPYGEAIQGSDTPSHLTQGLMVISVTKGRTQQ
jgi:hypothetical protein